MAFVNQNRQPTRTQGIIKIPVKSSFIVAIEFDPQNAAVTTYFKDGRIGQHRGATVGQAWLAFSTSQDHSKAWNHLFRGKHTWVGIKSAKAPRAQMKHKEIKRHV